MRTLLIFLALCACASAQPFAPLQYHRTASAATPPTDSLKLRLVASSITGKSSGDTTYIWPAAVGPNAYQLTAANKPIYYADSMAGKPAVRFDGADDIMSIASISLLSKKLTIVVVGRCANPKDARGAVCMVEHSTNFNTNNALLFYYQSSVTGDSSKQIFNTHDATFSRSISTNQTGIASFYFVGAANRTTNPDTVTVDLNRANTSVLATATPDNTGDFSSYPMYIGARSGSSFPMNGVIAEILIYTKLLSASERTQLDSYINQTYGL